MNKKAIWLIIILMSGALIGITIIQLFWIRWQVNLNETAFEDKVTMVLNQVKAHIERDAELAEEASSMISFKSTTVNPVVNKVLRSQSDDWRSQRLRKEVASTAMFLEPNTKLENIDKAKLDEYLKSELQNQGISIAYDYGIYSNKNEDFLIVNGNYVAQVSGNASNLDLPENRSLYNSNYSIPLFNTGQEAPGSIRLFFSNKTGYLWSKVWITLLSSILFTSIILFCFFYAIYTVFRQKKVSEMKTDFINNMTHEFKTPIATISLATDSITSDKIIHDESKIKRFAGIIKEENKRMLNQVEKVLQMARIDKQDFKLRVTPINLNDTIRKAAENMSLKVEKRNGSLKTDLKAENPMIEGDQNHISNIIHNLLDNAEKYSPENPDINISTKNVKDGVEITVKDSGIGMNKEALKHIFDKFYRVHTGNRHDVKGFGLGLSYVKALVTAHNGNINVSSELGTGSSFTIFLPFTHC